MVKNAKKQNSAEKIKPLAALSGYKDCMVRVRKEDKAQIKEEIEGKAVG